MANDQLSPARLNREQLLEFAQNHMKGYGAISDLCERYLEIEAACSQPVAPGGCSPFPWHVEPTRNGEAWLLVDAAGEKVALANCIANAKQNMEAIAAMTLAVPPAVSTPRCPSEHEIRTFLRSPEWLSAKLASDEEVRVTQRWLAQFFQPDSQPSPEGERK